MMNTKSTLPALPTAIANNGKRSAFLAKVRAAAVPTNTVMSGQGRASLLAAAVASTQRPRLVLAVDATASREPAWEAAKRVTDTLFTTLPGELDVALAVHGGSHVHTFTPFTTDAATLRDRAASVYCRSGQTRLLDILARVQEQGGVKVVVYIGDVYEESLAEGLALADALRLRGTKLVVLHDTTTGGREHAEIFAQLAERTGGCVLPFHTAIDQVHDMLEAVAVLAVGGVKLLEAKRRALPGACLLLEHLSGK